MKAIIAAVAIFAGLLLASLLNAPAYAPTYTPAGSGKIVQRADKPCQANSVLVGGKCACPEATSWTGAECMQVWSSSDRPLATVAPPGPGVTRPRQVATN